MMSKEDLVLLNSLKFSINTALCSAVIPSLRKVILKWQPGDETAWIIFYHDGEVGDVGDVIENHYSCMATEVHADFVCEPYIDFEVIRCDYPDPLPEDGYTIYARKEPFIDPKKTKTQQEGAFVKTEEDIRFYTDLRLSINRALWNEVIPSLREVVLRWEPGDETAWIIFYYAGELNDKMENHCSGIYKKVRADFPNGPCINFKVMCNNYPKPSPRDEHAVFCRREPFEDPH